MRKVEKLQPYKSEHLTHGDVIGLANKIRAGKVSDVAIVWRERLPDSSPQYRSAYYSRSGDCGNGLVGALEWVKHRIMNND